MRIPAFNVKNFIILVALMVHCQAHAWGERGHHAICAVASTLVENPELRNFLQARAHMLGYLCNIPDIAWRDADQEKVADATHYFNPDRVGLRTQDFPTDLQAGYEKYLAQASTMAPPLSRLEFYRTVGSSWWRAEQFFRQAVAAGAAATATKPAHRLNDQDYTLPYNQQILEMLTMMGILGHFVGDNTQPYHNVSDYDGYQRGHGGIHAFYESVCVNEYPADLEMQLYRRAKALGPQIKAQLLKSSVPDLLKTASLAAQKDLKSVENKDRVKKASLYQEGGMRVPAQRDSAAKACPEFYPLILKQMALATAQLAGLWEKIYRTAGTPPLAPYRSYKYPHAPALLPPDYLSPAPTKSPVPQK